MIAPTVFRRVLCDHLNEVLPAGFRAWPTDAGVWLDAPDGLGALGWTGHLDGDGVEIARFANAARTVLNSVQDCVTMTLREPWPSAAGAALDLAMPSATLAGTTLRLGYGDNANPVVRLRPIALEA